MGITAKAISVSSLLPTGHPKKISTGKPGESCQLFLELKLLADVGIIGFPNAGKSTLISRISNARPKVAGYPFTTLVPNLGIVRLDVGESFVAADIPGLIEGAHKGKGLGHQFLRHIERTRLLLHLIDFSDIDSDNILDRYHKLQNELKAFSENLFDKPQILVATKMDDPQSVINLEKGKAVYEGNQLFAFDDFFVDRRGDRTTAVEDQRGFSYWRRLGNLMP